MRPQVLTKMQQPRKINPAPLHRCHQRNHKERKYEKRSNFHASSHANIIGKDEKN